MPAAEATTTPELLLTLGFEPDGIRVRWRLSGVRRVAGEAVACLPLTIAGGPTIALEGAELLASDDAGILPLSVSDHDDDGDVLRVWTTARATEGAITVDHVARPNPDEPLAATPPLELRLEGGGLVGALKCFVVLPDAPDDLAFRLRAEPPAGWTVVTGLGELATEQDEVAGRGLERLGDLYLMCGDLADRHQRHGDLSIWWLTPPGIDLDAFADRLAVTYRLMTETFQTPTHPYRVFFRSHPHRGLNGSGHPASFVLAVNPDQPLAESKIYETVAHELVHEWLRLDGPEGDVRWFTEGSADYYSLVVPFRAGLLDEEAFLRAVNHEARTCYANPRRDLAMDQAERLFFSDFFAHWLPYARGTFYLADVDGRLRAATSGERSVDDVVREVTRRRRVGEAAGVTEWCALVDETLGGDERSRLDALVWSGTGRPAATTTFGADLEVTEGPAPTLDLGLDPVSLISRRVTGLVPNGPADRAGLREGEAIELPGYHDLLALESDDVLTIGVTRDGRPAEIGIPLSADVVVVPRWRRRATP